MINNTSINKYLEKYLEKGKNTIEKTEDINNQIWQKEITFNKDVVQVDLITEYNKTTYHVKYQYQGDKCKALTQQFSTSLSFK